MEQKFLECKKCGNIIAAVKESGVAVMCCGQKMERIEAGVVEASYEKHIPVVERDGNFVKVTVGSVEHPMVDVHYIEWISVQTNLGNQRKILKPNDEPKASFVLLENEVVEAVYAYCNLHGLWKAE
ncbi:MAG: desulfoferrodoxin [Bacilli bacterium]|nr:desulfoferrodoxin [Bacilli bacterium]